MSNATEPTSPAPASVEAAPAAAPRDLTPAARRAAWGQPAVRFWFLVAAVLLAGMLWLAASQVVEWSRDARLIREGAVVDATVFEAGNKIKGKPVPPLGNVDLTYDFEGKPYKVTGELAERPPGVLLTGDLVTIRVDRTNPRVWTDRKEAAGIAGRLVAPLMILPAALAAALVAWWQRRRVTRLWTRGEPREAVVVDTRQSPLAPLSQAVRCALADGSDRRLITVYVPARTGKVKKGDRLWLVAQPGNPQRAVAARGFAG